jgi:hypothetical protein
MGEAVRLRRWFGGRSFIVVRHSRRNWKSLENSNGLESTEDR